MATNEQKNRTRAIETKRGIDDELTALQLPGLKLLATIWRRKLVVITAVGACAVVAAARAYVTAPVYSSFSQIYVDQGGRNLLSGDNSSSSMSMSQLATQCEVLRSSHILSVALADPLVATLPSVLNDELTLAQVKRSLDASVGRNDETITVRYESASPTEAGVITDAIVRAYVAFNSDQHKSNTLDTLRILQDEKTKLENELRAKTTSMVEFQKLTGMLSADGERDDMISRRNLSEALSQARLVALDANTMFDAASRSLGEPDKVRAYLDSLAPGSVPFTTGAEAPQLAAELNASQQRLREITRVYGPNHPSVRDARSRIDQLAVQYLSALLQNARQSDARVQALVTSLAGQQKDALETATRAAEFRRLDSELRTTQSSVDALGGRISQLKIAEDKPAMSVTVLEPAGEGMKVRPNRTAMVFQGMMVGLLLGCGLALVDRRVRGAEELAQLVGLPLLGSVPAMPGKRTARNRAKLVQLEPSSDGAEAYRALRAALHFGLKGDDARTILIASPTPGDGKTTLATNLAIAMAQAGHRTLIIDADFRQPAQHRIFEVKDDTGLSSVLQQECELDAAIQPTGVKGLSILPAGPAPMSPADLLNGENFADVMHTVAVKFDYVIIDSPPVLAATDARLIGAMTDATLLTVRYGKSLRKAAVEARELLSAVGAKLIGIVVNDLPRAQTTYAGYDGSASSPVGAYDDASVAPVDIPVTPTNGKPATVASPATSGTPAKTLPFKPKANLDPATFAMHRKRN